MHRSCLFLLRNQKESTKLGSEGKSSSTSRLPCFVSVWLPAETGGTAASWLWPRTFSSLLKMIFGNWVPASGGDFIFTLQLNKIEGGKFKVMPMAL